MRKLDTVLAGAVAATVLLVAIAAAVALGIGFALFGFYLYLTPSVSDTAAALATGALGLVVAVVIAAVFALAVRLSLARSRASRRAQRSGAPQQGGSTGGDAMLRTAGAWIGENPMTASLGALGAGIVLGLNPELRRALADGIAAWMRASRGGSPDG